MESSGYVRLLYFFQIIFFVVEKMRMLKVMARKRHI